EGSNSFQGGSLTIDQSENEGMHSLGFNGSATGNEMVATLKDGINNSEGENENIQNVDAIQANQPSKSDYSLFTKSENGNFVALLVYVDDIIITGYNTNEIEKLKNILKTKFQIKDLGKLKYLLGNEVLETDQGLCLS
ncbi:ribonuclease H-like domain-containing protein, partial [Tanacetum coccineum]